MSNLARQLYDVFFEGCTHYATAKKNAQGKVEYAAIEGIPSLALVEKHIAGKVVLGAYTLLPNNTVRWMAFDVDSKKLGLAEAKRIAKKLCEFLKGVSFHIEFSGSKGYHIFIFFDKVYPAKDVKQIGDSIRDLCGLPKSGDPHVEVYPKQGELTKTNPYGNLLRLPGGIHPGTKKKTYFFDSDGDWEEAGAKDATELFSKTVTLAELQKLAEAQDPYEQILAILSPYWVAGMRHDMALCVSGWLATSGWTQEEVKGLVTDLHEEDPSGDLENQLQTVKDTFGKVYKGEKVLGIQGLAEVIPAAQLQTLITLISKKSSPIAMQIVDRIRLGKGTPWQKVRWAAQGIVSNLRENGKLVKDVNFVYWLNGKTRRLTQLKTPDWDLLMHNSYGLNPLESFGSQTMVAVYLMAKDTATLLEVKKRSTYKGQEFFMNLGGPEVYVFNGNPAQRRVIFNGEEGVLFDNSHDGLNLPNILEATEDALDVWDFLVNDVHFEKTDDVSMSPEQQRELLKAFFLSIFFSELLPTRPILTILADPGAGKTTTARRLLQFFEGLSEDVLGAVADKPDSFRTSLVAHKILVLDNLEETKASWLTDNLNRVATGVHIEIRKLHTTNDIHRIVPDCFIIITATKTPFSEETVFSRMLPVHLFKSKYSTPENIMRSRMSDNFVGLWKGMFDYLDQIVTELNSHTAVEIPSETRLADFSMFCHRIKGAECIDEDSLIGGLGNLVNAQRQALAENTPFIEVLQFWLRGRSEESTKWQSVSELFPGWQRTATTFQLAWRWNSAQGLSSHIRPLEPQLEANFGMESREIKENGRKIKQYRFTRKAIVDKSMKRMQ